MKGPQEVHQWSKVGAFLGMTAVALGAYGAHGLKATPKLVDSWKTAAQVRIVYLICGLGTTSCRSYRGFGRGEVQP
jgi:uncharacterized membrane protein YgdD (TMEM256/DUF423 family)